MRVPWKFSECESYIKVVWESHESCNRNSLKSPNNFCTWISFCFTCAIRKTPRKSEYVYIRFSFTLCLFDRHAFALVFFLWLEDRKKEETRKNHKKVYFTRLLNFPNNPIFVAPLWPPTTLQLETGNIPPPPTNHTRIMSLFRFSVFLREIKISFPNKCNAEWEFQRNGSSTLLSLKIFKSSCRTTTNGKAFDFARPYVYVVACVRPFYLLVATNFQFIWV